MTLLSTIRSPEDLKRLRRDQLPQLAQEIRDRLIECCSITGGHIGASLGVVELAQQARGRDQARIGTVHAGDIGPDLERHGTGAGRKVGGRGVRTAAPQDGGAAIGRLNASGDNEGGFLDPLREVVASGKTFADRLLERYHGAWNNDVRHVYEEYSF